ncbi:MAG TPA: hypothetical protein VMZ69_10900 [Saprospiraceae bacterium]|nr:hypothetical protein [Saprospiraceae bacterium]
MSRITCKPLILSFFFLCLTALAVAQPKDNSPFSQFGLGDFLETDLPSSHGMGGLSSVYHDFFEANLENPASLGFLQYTSLQIGMYAKRAVIKRFDDKQTVWSGNLDHISLNIPLINPLNEALERRETKFSWGTSVSLRPYTQVGYHIQINDSLPNFGDVERVFTGSGGLFNLTWGNGIKYKNLSAGINLGYIYGKQNFEQQTEFPDIETAYSDIFQSTIAYKGFNYRVGVLYEQPLDLKEAREKEDNPTKLLSIGAFAGGQTTLDTKSDIAQIAILSIQNTIIDVDTSLFETDLEGESIMPGTWGIGLMYRQAGKFRVGIDYQGAEWSNYINPARPAAMSEMKDSYRVGAGVSWIPDANAITSYFKRVEYRAGFYTMTDPRVIDGEQVKASALTVGAGFPLILQRNIAWVQVGLDIGKRTGGNLSDNFIRGKVGLILNDNSWFIKGKYN